MKKIRVAAGLAAASTLLLMGAQPASAATSGTEEEAPPPYCSLNLATDVMICAPTEAALIAKKGVQPFATTYLMARFYDKADWKGPWLEVFNTAPCDTSSDVDFESHNIGSTWNDRISSFRGYSACEVRLWENDYWGGASTGGPFAERNYVGDAMNDEATSYRLY